MDFGRNGSGAACATRAADAISGPVVSHGAKAVRRGPAEPGGERDHQAGDVAPADQPRRLRRGQPVPVQLVEQVDGQLTAERWYDGRHGWIAQEVDQLGGPLLLGCGAHRVAGHALADHDLEAPVAQPLEVKLQPGQQLRRHATGRRRDRDPVTKHQRVREQGHGLRLSAR